MQEQLIESNYKRFSFLAIDENNFDAVNDAKYNAFIKILYLPAGCTLSVDFKSFTTQKSSLFFVNYGQHFSMQHAASKGCLLYYNRDFYCVQIHDDEVACDGLLFNNIYGMPMVSLTTKEDLLVSGLFKNISDELLSKDYCCEEMVRTYLKQIIINATRIWKQQQLSKTSILPNNGLTFFRSFSRLVEIYFREKHNVADYADLLFVAPKTLSKKFNQFHLSNPNEIIKDRICLEAKRLLVYTEKSVKEIAYSLGYDDPAYFNRIFTAKMGYTPATFRKDFFND